MLIPVGVSAVVLSVASIGYACTIMGGQTFLDYCRKSFSDPISEPCNLTLRPGYVLGVYATGVPASGTLGPINYLLGQDQNGTYCHPGFYPMTAADGTTPIYRPSGIPSGDIGSATSPIEGKLRSGQLGKGQAYICFSDGSYATWPVSITVA